MLLFANSTGRQKLKVLINDKSSSHRSFRHADINPLVPEYAHSNNLPMENVTYH